MDRNAHEMSSQEIFWTSLSARRAWIEIMDDLEPSKTRRSLSARRAWIEIASNRGKRKYPEVALRKESVDRNFGIQTNRPVCYGRSPQGERG